MMTRAGLPGGKTCEGCPPQDGKTNTASPHLADLRGRVMQTVIDHIDSDARLTTAVRNIASKLGCAPDRLLVWYKQPRRGAGKEARPTQVAKPARAP